MEKSQREYYLNEQMKAIQKELGELDDAPNELAELEKIAAPACRRKPARRPRPRAQQAQADVADVGGSHRRAQLHRLAAVVPWKKRTKVKQDLAGAERSSTKTTTASRRSRSASSSTSPCSSA
jgi:ATP-dependent Lon protease